MLRSPPLPFRRRVRASSTVCAALRPSTPKPSSCFTCTDVPAVHRPSCSQMTSQGCRRPALRPPRGDRGGAGAPYSKSSSCRRPSTCRAHAFKLATAGRCRPRCRPSRVPLHRRRRRSRLCGATYRNPTAVAAAPTHPIPSRAPAVDLRAAAPMPPSPPPPAAVDPPPPLPQQPISARGAAGDARPAPAASGPRRAGGRRQAPPGGPAGRPRREAPPPARRPAERHRREAQCGFFTSSKSSHLHTCTCGLLPTTSQFIGRPLAAPRTHEPHCACSS